MEGMAEWGLEEGWRQKRGIQMEGGVPSEGGKQACREWMDPVRG